MMICSPLFSAFRHPRISSLVMFVQTLATPAPLFGGPGLIGGNGVMRSFNSSGVRYLLFLDLFSELKIGRSIYTSSFVRTESQESTSLSPGVSSHTLSFPGSRLPQILTMRRKRARGQPESAATAPMSPDTTTVRLLPDLMSIVTRTATVVQQLVAYAWRLQLDACFSSLAI